MADFIQAVKWMKEGKKVTRKKWRKFNEFIIFNKFNDVIWGGEGNGTNWMIPTGERVLATDWEIYMEKCDYCGADVKIRNPTGNYDHLYYPKNVNKNYPEPKGDWDLAFCRNKLPDNPNWWFHINDVKTFIQKVKEDCLNEGENLKWHFEEFEKVLDKRAGDL